MPNAMLSLFQASGIELEYMIVDRTTLDVRPIADQVFKDIAGEYTAEIERGPISLNNELAMHVVELKTTKPAKSLDPLPELFHQEIQHVNQRLEKYNAMLMPSAMHPWMDSMKEFKLWNHDDKEIYDTLHSIFDCRGHGWANLQSTHLNLPFGNEEEFWRLHSAIRLVLPLIPTLAASSPYADGKETHCKDFRIETYKKNAKKIFSVTGYVIPEVCKSFADYQTTILEPIYRDLAPFDPNGVLRYEWANARGAITRFDRNAIEIRLTDIQEIPSQDCAIAWALTAVVRALCEEQWASIESIDRLSCPQLLKILDRTYVDAEDTLITDMDYLKALGWPKKDPPRAKQLWDYLLHRTFSVPDTHAAGLDFILSHGTLATRIIKAVGPRFDHRKLKAVYQELCRCLQDMRIFKP